MTSSLPGDTTQPTRPNASRIYNYTLGGSYYFPVDQAAAEYMFSLVPSTPKWVRMLRAFLHHAARQLADAGVTHVVDFASGIPTGDHIHTQLPHARIVRRTHNSLPNLGSYQLHPEALGVQLSSSDYSYT